MLKKKLSIIIIIIFILALGLFYWLKFLNNTNIPNQSISADANQSVLINQQISEEILKKIGPPPDYDKSKIPADLDPKILKRIGPPANYKPSVSNEINPEILKLIGPPASNNK